MVIETGVIRNALRDLATAFAGLPGSCVTERPGVSQPAPGKLSKGCQIALKRLLQPGLRRSEREQQEQGQQRETSEVKPAQVCEHSAKKHAMHLYPSTATDA